MKNLLVFLLISVIGFSVYAQEITINMRYNVLRSEPSRDYFNWSIGNRCINDSYDAISGASIARSTREFDAVRYDTPSTRRYTLPRGIRHLVLFPVASRQYTDNFNLTVHEEGQRLIIRFIVYGTAYQIQTDDNKKIDIRTACFIAEGITESNSLVSPIRSRYLKPGNDPRNINSVDWDKINWVPDTAVSNASRKYNGVLTAGYANGILILNGVLKI
ncbi:hypothetical protein ACYULU_12965 [Breznakiellaceae bacterium SP9]